MKFCIYIIQNTVNNKIYVGQTSNFDNRIKKHKRIAKLGKDQRHLYRAINKYKWENFTYFIIEYFSNINDVNDAEEFWIAYFRSWDRSIGYNLTFGGGCAIPTIETREKMRIAKLGKPNPKMQGSNHPFYGVKGEKHHRYGILHTQDAKNKIAKANIGRDFPKGSAHSNSILTEESVLYIREYFFNNQHIKTKDAVSYLSTKFNVEESTIENIIYNVSWKHVKKFDNTNKNIKIKDTDVIFIRQQMNLAINKTAKRKELAIQFNVSKHTIYEIETKRKRKKL